MIGVFGFHRAEAGDWSEAEIALAEAVARELGIAIHAAQLLKENAQRLEQQAALLKAAQVVTSELRLETVLQRLVVEVTKLLDADAADCYLYDADRSILRCAAVYGLDPELVELEFPAARSPEERFREPVPHRAYEGFESAISAQMTWSGERRGILGVATRDPKRQFGEVEANLLEAFAGLASLAVRNAASFEQSVRQERVQRGFYGIASALAEHLSQSDTLDAVAQAATEALGGSFAAVLMPGARGLELAASYRLPDELAASLEDGVPRQRASLDDRRERAAAPLGVARSTTTSASARSGGGSRACARSSRSRSIRRGARKAGSSSSSSPSSARSRDDDLELGRRLAGAARGGLERSELYESERTARALSQQLARMGGLLATELDPAAILDEVADQAPALLGADACAIQLVAATSSSSAAVGARPRRAIVGHAAASTARPAGDVVQSRAPVALADAAEDRRLLADDPVLAAGHSGYLGVPLVGLEGGFQGVLAVYSQRPRVWREEEVEALVRPRRERLGRALERRALPAGRDRAGAQLRDPREHRRRDRRRRPRGQGRPLEPVGRADHGSPLGRSARADAARGPAAGARVRRRGSHGERLALGAAWRRGGWLSLTEAIMRDPVGAVSGRIFAFRDVSAERIVEQMKSDFVSTVSHELRAPLTSIYGFAETLLRRDVLFGEEERETFLGYIASEAQRLTSIVDTLLGVARLEAGDLHVELAPTDLRAVVSEVVTSVRQTSDVNGHRVRAPSARRAARCLGRPREAEPDPDEPARQRGQVLAGRRHRDRRGASAQRTASRCASSTKARASRRPSASASSRSSTAPRPRAAPAVPGSGSSSRAASSAPWAVVSGSTPSKAEARASPSSLPLAEAD